MKSDARPRTEIALKDISPPLTPRELRYVQLLTQVSTPQLALNNALFYLGFINSEGAQCQRRPLKYRLARLRELAAMPCDWFDKR